MKLQKTVKKPSISDRWIIDHKGKRKYGSVEFMRANLESNAREAERYGVSERNSFADIQLKMHAVRAWHWALALQGK